jgi:hypothetical protein
MKGRWIRSQGPGMQGYETPCYGTDVVSCDIDTAEAEQQLAHARQQEELQGLYPGRVRQPAPRVEVIELDHDRLPVGRAGGVRVVK